MLTPWYIKNAVSLQNLIAQVSEITSDEIIITDRNQKILYVNPAFTTITGFSPEEVLGKEPSILKSGKHSKRFYDKMWDTLSNGEAFRKIMINRHKNGYLFYEEKVIIPVKDIHGEIMHYVSTGRDVTQRIELQKSLKRQSMQLVKANKDMETFVYKAAHDIRGPLASIIGIANMFSSEIVDEKALQYCDYIKSCAQNLDEILKSMLHLQVLNNSEPVITRINFQKLIDRLLNSFKYYEGFNIARINVSIELENDFFSDESSIFCVFQNLIHNAVKFRKLGRETEIYVCITPFRNGVKIKVEDNGIGVKKQHIDKIFNMFYRANTTHKGSGLGLYFVDQIVRNLKGKITFLSEEGTGTKVSIAIPNNLYLN